MASLLDYQSKSDYTDEAELEKKARKVTASKAIDLSLQKLDLKKPVLENLSQIHKTLFEEVYTFAGKIRGSKEYQETVGGKPDLYKIDQSASYEAGITIVSKFTPGGDIEKAGQKLDEKLRSQDFLQNKYKPEFVESIAEIAGEINQMHPFREGNGRTQRIYLDQIAEQAGYHLAWENISKQENIEVFAAATEKEGWEENGKQTNRNSEYQEKQKIKEAFKKIAIPMSRDLTEAILVTKDYIRSKHKDAFNKVFSASITKFEQRKEKKEAEKSSAKQNSDFSKGKGNEVER